MNDDVERDLRELFDRKTGSVGGVAPKLPEQVRKRGRRRQLGTALVSGATVLAVLVASVGVIRAIDPGRDRRPIPVDDPWEGYETFERTATIETLTVTSPSDWYLVNQWPMGARAARGSTGGTCSVTSPPDGGEQSEVCSERSSERTPDGSLPMVPILMLSNTDLGLGPSACLDGDLGLQGDEAVLEVALDTRAVNLIEAGNAPDLPGWPAAFSNEVTGGPCGSGYYVRFQVGRYPYVAWAGFGPDASQEVREALFEIASTMEIDEQAFVRATRERTPAYVIAGGENAAGPWRLEARPSPLGALSSNVALTLFGAEGGSVVEGFGVPGVPIEQAGGDPTFGAVTKQAASVELRSDGVVAPARIVPVPPSLGSDFDLFFGSHEGDVVADAVALDADGQTLGGSYVVPPIHVTDDGNLVIARLEAFGSTWELSAPRDANSCSLRRTPSRGGGSGSCRVSTMSAGGPEGFAFVYGTLPDAASTALVVAADGATYPCGVLTAGPSGRRYFVIALEGPGPGEFRLLRADGTVIERREVSWADPTA